MIRVEIQATGVYPVVASPELCRSLSESISQHMKAYGVRGVLVDITQRELAPPKPVLHWSEFLPKFHEKLDERDQLRKGRTE